MNDLLHEQAYLVIASTNLRLTTSIAGAVVHEWQMPIVVDSGNPQFLWAAMPIFNLYLQSLYPLKIRLLSTSFY